MIKVKALQIFADIISALYILKCFLRPPAAELIVIFSRGAFQRDVASIGRGSHLVIIRSEWLRRFMRIGVADSCLEQVISLSYKNDLRAAFGLSLKVFHISLKKLVLELFLGGLIILK
ncbi:hypothetical protein [Chromobacterium vaccinii]|uniref:hypothetical protein n=1 Tax=Chromobacterium vaccinii TaxID=1108595 RepID=UPI0011C02137|nr:hypothetical protein [Chromobacterium vaccinii]